MIDTNAIRSKILLLALQGKLTEQLAEDGNAQELYDDIQKDKCVLLQQGKIKKEKPLPPITEKSCRLKFLKIGNGLDGENCLSQSNMGIMHQRKAKEK